MSHPKQSPQDLLSFTSGVADSVAFPSADHDVSDNDRTMPDASLGEIRSPPATSAATSAASSADQHPDHEGSGPFAYRNQMVTYSHHIPDNTPFVIEDKHKGNIFVVARGSVVQGEQVGSHENGKVAIFASRAVQIRNSDQIFVAAVDDLSLRYVQNAAFLGFKRTNSDVFPQNLEETTVVRNLHLLGNLTSSTPLNSNTEVFTGETGGSTFTLDSASNADILYVNPINGPVYINLGTADQAAPFVNGRSLTIKDSTLSFGDYSANNVYVKVPEGTYIENYSGSNLVQSNGGTYVLNTSGGSVNLRYNAPLMPGGRAGWSIINQFAGNPRVLAIKEAAPAHVREVFFK